MRDIVSCFSENAIGVSPSTCSSYSSNACLAPTLIPAVRNAVICVYKTTLSSQKHLLITVTWTRSHMSQGLAINIGDDPSASFKLLNTNSRFLRKKKGSKVIESDNPHIEVSWDLSNAKYEMGPEPVEEFYVIVTIDSELGLSLGDMAEEAISKKFKSAAEQAAKFSLLSRKEHCSGNTLYCTKAQFSDTGIVHDILIRCSGENDGMKHPALFVYVDKKMVMRVKRLQWNFRGNQTIFIDGLLVDLMWDVHDWFYSPASGYAVFMFRTRSGLDSRLWLEEKMVPKDQDRVEFSLLIYASKSP